MTAPYHLRWLVAKPSHFISRYFTLIICRCEYFSHLPHCKKKKIFLTEPGINLNSMFLLPLYAEQNLCHTHCSLHTVVKAKPTFETFKTVLIVIQRLRSELAHICISCFVVRGLMTLNKTHGKQPNQKLMPPFLNELLKLFRKSGLFLETTALRKALICGGNLWGQSGIKLYQAGPHPSWKRSSLSQEINTK